jgi:hypothetical protein
MKLLNFARHVGTRMILIAVFLLPLIAGFATPALAEEKDRNPSQRIYTMTNAAGGNEVVEIRRAGDGSTSLTMYPTGGLGSGAGLGSQGAVILQGSWLFAVNAGSNQISVFAVGKHGLTRTDVVEA